MLFLLYIYPSARPLPLEGQTAASSIAGIWENRTRIISFDDGNASREEYSSGKLGFVLKTWYGWYYDEMTGYTWSYVPNSMQGRSGILTITYPNRRGGSMIPVYIGEDELYLDFLVRDDANDGEHPLAGFWKAGGNASGSANGIMIIPPRYSKEVYGYYFTPDNMYRIRYWLTDMEYDPEATAFIMDDGNEYEVGKFISLSGKTYTCAAGRGRLVRNPEKTAYTLGVNTVGVHTHGSGTLLLGTPDKKELPFRLSADGTILSFAEPWITRSAITDLENEISTHNRMRRPQREPPLEFMELDFRWDEIEEIRNNGAASEN